MQISHKVREMYWLIGRKSNAKRLIYQSIIKPICTKESNKLIIQRCQNTFLRMITDAYRYVTNEEHNDLDIKWVNEVIQDYAVKREKRLLRHINVEVIQLLGNSEDVKRLKRTKPYELVK